MFYNYRKFLKRFLTAILTVTMLISSVSVQITASTTPKPTTPEGIEKYDIAYRTELESILLLQNNARSDGTKKMLPLDKTDDRIAIFGRGQNNNIAGSSGSGTVSGAFSYTFLEGLSEIQATNIQSVTSSTTWNTSTEYPGKWGTRQSSGTGWNMSSPIQTAENKYTDAAVSAPAAQTKKAVVFLLRLCGTEEMDRASNPPQPSDWYLNPSELTMLAQVVSNYDDVILVYSGAGQMDLTWMDFKWMQTDSTDYYSTNAMYTGTKVADASAYANKIKAIVWSYGSGGHYGLALAKLMYGEESFSAKLADTITYDWYDHFTSKNFGGSQTYGNNGAGINFNDGAGMNTINGVNDPVTVYQEFIYSGHRYFDTFMGNRPAGQNPVLFPFGFGLTYADFTFSNMSVSYAGNKLTVNSRITNTAGLAGKEVMEVYVSAPNDKTLDQPYQKLIGYAKTGKLAQGEGQNLSVDVPLDYIASYDESRAAYILEEGSYIIRVGNSSRNTAVAGILNVSNGGAPIIVEQLKNRITLNQGGSSANQAAFDSVRLNSKTTSSVSLKRWDGTTVTIPVSSLSGPVTGGNTVTINAGQVTTVNNSDDNPAYVPGTAPTDKAYTLQSVKDGTISLKDFTAQLTNDELVPFLSGGTNTGPAQTYSDDTSISLMNTANALSKPNTSNARVTGAGSSRGIQRLGIPSLTYADGSAGISISAAIATNLGIDRNPGYARAAGIACTWNPDLEYEWGTAMGKEMRRINVDILLAPSINMHRNPLNGRNTEYYSEDPFLSGAIASYVAAGVADQGVTVCLKHFAGNDQEQYRRGFHTAASVSAGTSKDAINTIISERGLRELVLRPFEMAVKTGRIRTVMSAFNKINGQFAAASDDLLTNILRGEWGFKGYVVCDWGDFDEIAHAADEMRTGNDMIMSGTHNRYSIPAQIWNGLRGIADYDGVAADPPKGAVHPVTKADLERNATNVLSTILQSPNAFNAAGKYNTDILNGTIQYHVKRALSIQTTRLPIAIVGKDYRTIKVNPLLAAGNEGTSSYTFSVDAASAAQLPAGMTLLGNGQIAGSPAAGTVGTYNITFRVTDSDGNFVTKALSLEVKNLSITTTAINQFRLGVPFDQTISVDAGSPVTFSVIGTLPTGITLDPATGRLSGTVSAADVGKTFNFAIKAASGTGSEQLSCTAIVKDYIDLVTTPENNRMTMIRGASGITIATSATRSITGDAFTNSIVGTLPAGMSFNTSNRNITGTPTQVGVFPITIVVSLTTDPTITVSKNYVIEVVEDPDPSTLKILTESLPYGKATVSYTAQIVAAGGTGTRSFAIVPAESSSKLPSGLAITNAGVLSCSPGLSDSGLYKVAVRYTMGSSNVVKIFDLYIAGVLNSSPAAGSSLGAMIQRPFSQTITVSGGFSGDYTFKLDAASDALPAGLTFADNGDFTAKISGTPAVGTEGAYDIAIYVNETFAGSPVDTVLYYKLSVYNSIVEKPVITTFPGAQGLVSPSLAVRSSADDARYYYTYDGSQPTDTSAEAVYQPIGDVYPIPFPDSSCTVKAVAYKEGSMPSEIAEYDYRAEAEVPVGLRASGTYRPGFNLSVSPASLTDVYYKSVSDAGYTSENIQAALAAIVVPDISNPASAAANLTAAGWTKINSEYNASVGTPTVIKAVSVSTDTSISSATGAAKLLYPSVSSAYYLLDSSVVMLTDITDEGLDWQNPAHAEAIDDIIDAVIARMTQTQKVTMLYGIGVFPSSGPGPTTAGATYAIPSLGIPNIWMSDGPAGLRMGVNATCWMGHAGLASSWDRNLVETFAGRVAEEAKYYGISVLLAPGQNIHRSPLGGRNFEYFSEDPIVTGEMAAAYTRGAQNNGVGVSLKHYAANNSEKNRSRGNEIISNRAMREIYLTGYEIAAKEKPWTVMSAYNAINGIYASSDKALLTDVLRGDFGFDGFVVSDWGANYEPAKGVLAGMDNSQYSNISSQINTALNNGTITIADVEICVKNILRVAIRSEAFKGNTKTRAQATALSNAWVGSDMNKVSSNLNRKISADCLVLLKNDNNALPLKGNEKITLVTSTIPYDQSRGGTLSMGMNTMGQGTTSVKDLVLMGGGSGAVTGTPKQMGGHAVSLEEGLKEVGFDLSAVEIIRENTATAATANDAAAKTDAAILVISRLSSEGADNTLASFSLSANEERMINEYTRSFKAAGKPVIVIFNVGGSIDTTLIKEKADAILDVFVPGFDGGYAIADVLNGTVNPSGRLTQTFPTKFEYTAPMAMAKAGHKTWDNTTSEVMYYDEGVFVGYRYYDTKLTPEQYKEQVAFPFGHGLSYTTFKYELAGLDKRLFDPSNPDDSITVTAKVTNTGSRAGKTAVQMYIGASSYLDEARPIKELKDYGKTKLLQPGEAEEFNFAIKLRDLQYFNDGNPENILDAANPPVGFGSIGSWTAKVGTTYTVTIGGTSDASILATEGQSAKIAYTNSTTVDLLKNDGEAAAMFTLVNNNNTAAEVKCILAIYDKGSKLVEIKSIDVTVAANSDSMVNTSLPLAEGCTAKAYAWSADYAPLANAVSIE